MPGDLNPLLASADGAGVATIYDLLQRLIVNHFLDSNHVNDIIRRLPIRSLKGRRHDASSEEDGLHKVVLAPCDHRLLELEVQVSTMMLQPAASAGVMAGALRCVIQAACKYHKCDVAIVDFSPNAGMLNRLLLNNCTHIVPCCFPDYYNLASVRGFLEYVYPSVKTSRDDYITKQREMYRHSQVGEALLEHYHSLKLPDEAPYILPTIVTNFNVAGFNTGEIQRHQAYFIKNIDKFYKLPDPGHPLEQHFRRAKIILYRHPLPDAPPELEAHPAFSGIVVAALNDVHSTQQLSQRYRVAIPFLATCSRDFFLEWKKNKTYKRCVEVTRHTFMAYTQFVDGL